MRMRNPKDKDEVINSCDFFYDGFNNDNPIHLEIGMGKGKFILEMALKYPDINFIGVEKYSSVASVAIKRIREIKPDNLRIMIMDAKNLSEVLEGKVDTIYLNFSDPWPKDRHAKRRLTARNFLESYDKLFRRNPHIVMKTDNDNLFQYSLESFKEYGYKINKISYDLHEENIDNVETEYEEKFSKNGIKIKYVDVSK
ncbi:MAG TPA: tRNA (guanosine(46)-N7)-methyltransferase TrmB [Candidatus Onthocola stercoravium]|nr:tRNA (guanosine(46)-N7)-methyltransferase TrmB [Candidatus Onthocola stercoravium]